MYRYLAECISVLEALVVMVSVDIDIPDVLLLPDIRTVQLAYLLKAHTSIEPNKRSPVEGRMLDAAFRECLGRKEQGDVLLCESFS